MSRTRFRPLPAGRIAPHRALLFGIVLSLLAVRRVVAGCEPAGRPVGPGGQLVLRTGLYGLAQAADDTEYRHWRHSRRFPTVGRLGCRDQLVLLNPRQLENPFWNYVTLGLAVLFEGTSFIIALRELLRVKGNESIWRAIHMSKDPAIFVVLFEDSAALVGLALAFLGVFFAHRFNNPRLDGVASILIGLLLATVSIVLAYESKGLLLGESADRRIVKGIYQLINTDQDVQEAREPLTMHFGPDDVLLNLDVQFRAELSGSELVAAIDRLEQKIRADYPEVKRIFVEADSFARSEGRTDNASSQSSHPA